MKSADNYTESLRITVHGVVQGVGFRPFIYRLAHSLDLNGFIINSGDGVRILINGTPEALQSFTTRIQAEAPPVARIVTLQTEKSNEPVPDGGFTIKASDASTKSITQIAPDIAACNDCLTEINDPDNRRFQYPFTNCTNCGPRFTIVKKIPYDRPNTSMRNFELCPECSKEYNDPLDRRFHAQPNACPQCGPSLTLHDAEGRPIYSKDILSFVLQTLLDHKIVAIKGLGGFHLAVDATSQTAVTTLRKRKNRKSKPLAIMVKDVAAAKMICKISTLESELLTSPEHPIVLLNKKNTASLAQDLAAGIGALGIMLPYTPLHHLLLNQPTSPKALVMTSGNLSDEPICTQNDEALERLRGIADFFLLHNRDILTRVDDSVARVAAGKPRLLRRARGFSPVPIQLQHKTKNILGCGAEKKSSFCIVRNQEAYISQHIGELTSPECLDFYTESIDHLQKVLESDITHTACDLHPDYLSSRYAGKLDLPCSQIQHHHAHTGAVMAEHGLDETVMSVILDGAGYGTDATIFGGEIYLADRKKYTRMGRLSHLPLPGGDKAAKEPWRMALALLYQTDGPEAIDDANLPSWLRAIEPQKRLVIGQLMQKQINSPLTSSCGRLFDAVAALVGLCIQSDYEGQAAMMLESQADLSANKPETATASNQGNIYKPALIKEADLWIIDSTALVPLILNDLKSNVPAGLISYRFHCWLIDSICNMLVSLRKTNKIKNIILSGGCMQNKLLLEGLNNQLIRNDFSVFTGEMVPVNDGGIALGQAYIGGY